MRMIAFVAAFVAVSTFAPVSHAMDISPPPAGSACDQVSKEFLNQGDGRGLRVNIYINHERNGTLTYNVPSTLWDRMDGIFVGALNDFQIPADLRPTAFKYGTEYGAWAAVRSDYRVQIFVGTPDGRCAWLFAKEPQVTPNNFPASSFGS